MEIAIDDKQVLIEWLIDNGEIDVLFAATRGFLPTSAVLAMLFAHLSPQQYADATTGVFDYALVNLIESGVDIPGVRVIEREGNDE